MAAQEQHDEPEPAAPEQGYRNTIISGACLSIAWFGDGVIYIVLPLYAATFGLDALLVGVLLSCNRVVRIVGYGWVAPLARRFGANMLTAAACRRRGADDDRLRPCGELHRLLHRPLHLGRRVGHPQSHHDRLRLWRRARRRQAHRRRARGQHRRADAGAGRGRPALRDAIGPHQMFVLYGLLSLIAVPIAFLLPPMRAEPKDDAPAEKRWTPTPLNILFFGLAFAADGVLGTTISVLLSDFMPTSQAIIGAGLIMAFRHVVGITLAFVSGPITDRIGARRLLIPCTLVRDRRARHRRRRLCLCRCAHHHLLARHPVDRRSGAGCREVDRSHRRARVLLDLERCRSCGRRISRHRRCCLARRNAHILADGGRASARDRLAVLRFQKRCAESQSSKGETPMATAQRIVLASRPVGEPKPENFRLEEVPVPTRGPGEVLLRTIWLSLDPYMRGRMSDAPSYAPPVQIGHVMEGGTVSEVVASKHHGLQGR